jgi:hypothetical protein
VQYCCTDASRWRRARRSSKSWVTRSNAKGRSDLQAAKTLIPRKQSYSRYNTSDWCGLPAASSFPRHWRRCSDGQRGKDVRRSLDADGCRDQYHKRKPLQVAINALHRISCCTAPPSTFVYGFVNEGKQGEVQNEGVLNVTFPKHVSEVVLFSNCHVLRKCLHLRTSEMISEPRRMYTYLKKP